MSIENVLPFGPRDSAVDRQEIVDTLHRMLEDHETLKGFAVNFKLAMRERVWERDRVFAGGTRQPPISFDQFICERYPVGIGASFELVENLIRGDVEALAFWADATKRRPGRPSQAQGEILYNIQDKGEAPTGTSAAAGLRRIQKEAGEGKNEAQQALEDVLANRKSVHQASVDLGHRKPTRIDPDVRSRCDKSNAEIIVEFVPQERLSDLVSDLFAAGHKSLGIEIKNLIGESIMDRRFG